MRITTRFTYILPFLVLAASIFFLTLLWSPDYFPFYYETYIPQTIIAILLTAGIYLALKKLAPKYPDKQLKIAALLTPLILHSLQTLILYKRIGFNPFDILLCGLFYLSYILFSKRYTATLTDNSIQYKTLLGLSGEIPLASIVKLEEKKNVLALFIRYLRFMNMARKISITFCDENLDEYEIDVFTNAVDSRKIFNKIIANANNCGNGKIRQYTA